MQRELPETRAGRARKFAANTEAAMATCRWSGWC